MHNQITCYHSPRTDGLSKTQSNRLNQTVGDGSVCVGGDGRHSMVCPEILPWEKIKNYQTFRASSKTQSKLQILFKLQGIF